MKTKIVYYFFISLVLAAGCEDKSEDPSPPMFTGVPSGEVVAVELRNEILTGSSVVTSGRISGGHKWWRHDISRFDFYECDVHDLDLTVPNTYLSFSPDHKIFVKTGINGVSQDSNVTWRWESNQKNGVILSRDPTVVFTFTALNASEVIYASRQEVEGCVAITWERFNEPHFDQ